MKVDVYISGILVATGIEAPKPGRTPRKLKKRIKKEMNKPLFPRSCSVTWTATYEGLDLSHLKV